MRDGEELLKNGRVGNGHNDRTKIFYRVKRSSLGQPGGKLVFKRLRSCKITRERKGKGSAENFYCRISFEVSVSRECILVMLVAGGGISSGRSGGRTAG